VRPDAWDALRIQTDGPFALPPTREAWEAQAKSQPEIGARARMISDWLDRQGAKSVASYGAGTGMLELSLHHLRPERGLVLTDYAAAAVERLAGLFPEARVVRHDLLHDPPIDADLHLFHRIDTEFDNRQWRRIYARFARLPVLVVATEVVDWERIVRAARSRLTQRGLTRAGWIRNRAAFEALWRPTHDSTHLTFNDLEAWALRPRAAR
jgi:hypothetical protein